MNKKNSEITKINKGVLTLILFLSLFFGGVREANAGYWGEGWGVMGVDNMFEKLMETLYDLDLGMAKQGAIKSIVSQVDSKLSGSSSGESFIIQDWDEYLFKASQDTANLYANDLLSVTAGGRNSRANYITKDGSFNYSRYLTEYAKSQSIGSGKTVKNNSLIAEIIGDPTVSKTGTAGWRRWSAIRQNNPMISALNAQVAVAEKKRQEERKAEIKALIGGGYKGVESEGKTITPGSTVKSLKDQSMSVAFEAISGANSIPEVVTAVASKIILQTFQKGIGQTKQNVKTENRSTPQTPKPWNNPNNY
jgi:hypothetical protein